MKKRQKILSLTRKDFEWDFVRGRGKGGQKKNKTSSAVRCRHLPSGAIGYAEDTRSQSKNRGLAFRRCAESKEFQRWIKIESARASGELVEFERKTKQQIDQELSDPNITKIEIKNSAGNWVRIQ